MKRAGIILALLTVLSSATTAASLAFGADAALRIETDAARFAFVFFDRFEGNYCETLNLTAKQPTPEIALDYVFARNRPRFAAGRATLREEKDGLAYANAFTAHESVKGEGLGYVLTLSADGFADLQWKADSASGTFPQKPGRYRLAAGSTRRLSLAFDPKRVWTVAFPSNVKFTVSDLRASGGTAFEIRILEAPFAGLGVGQAKACKCVFSCSDGKAAKEILPPEQVVEGEDWIRFDWQKGIRASSALDFSQGPHRRAPAGSEGRLEAKDGNLKFDRASRTVRLFGPTLSGSACLAPKAVAQDLARRLARSGYNSVRLTGVETALLGSVPGPDTFNKQEAEKFDTFVQVMEGEGLSVFREVVEARRSAWARFGFPPVNALPDVSPAMADALVLTYDPAFGVWKNFLRQSFVRKSTKSAKFCSQDPGTAVVATSVGGGLFPSWGDLRLVPSYMQAYEKWLTDHRAADPDFMKDAVCEPLDLGVINLHDRRAKSVRLHLAERETEGLRRERAFLADSKCAALFALKPGAPEFTDVAAERTEAADLVLLDFGLDPLRRLGDKTDANWRISNANPFASKHPIPARFETYEKLGKPFALAGWDIAPISPLRGAMGLYLGARAAREGWDGVWRAAYAWNAALLPEAKGSPLDGLYMNDPLALAGERAVFALFARGDFGPDDRLELADGALTVACPRTVGGYSPLETGAIQAGPLAALLSGHPATVWVSACDKKGLPVEKSNRLLVFHLTDAQRSGTLYSDGTRRLVLRRGTGPLLFRAGKADISLAVENPKGWKAYSLKSDGSRQNAVPVTVTDGKLAFTADVRGPSGAQYIYELIHP